MPEDIKRVKVKLIKSPVGYPKDQRATVEALKLKMGKERTMDVNLQIWGMLRKVKHLIKLEKA
jgi:large subunit ribosomal protein L30